MFIRLLEFLSATCSSFRYLMIEMFITTAKHSYVFRPHHSPRIQYIYLRDILNPPSQNQQVDAGGGGGTERTGAGQQWHRQPEEMAEMGIFCILNRFPNWEGVYSR